MLFNKQKLFWVVMAIIVGTTWQSCITAPDELEYDNPLDPTGDDYVPPITTILTAPSGTITTTTARISWSGSHEMLEFAYRLDGRAFSTWSQDTSAILDYLDEGEHLFEVKSRYPTGIEEDSPAQVAFIVDAVPPQSLLLYPYRVEVAQGDTFIVELRADSIAGLTVIDFTLEYDTTSVVALEATTGPFLAKDGGSLIFIEEFDPFWDVNLGVAQGPGEGVQGSGTILSFRFEVLTLSNSALTLALVDARGPNDEEVAVVTVRGAMVEAGE